MNITLDIIKNSIIKAGKDYANRADYKSYKILIIVENENYETLTEEIKNNNNEAIRIINIGISGIDINISDIDIVIYRETNLESFKNHNKPIILVVDTEIKPIIFKHNN